MSKALSISPPVGQSSERVFAFPRHLAKCIAYWSAANFALFLALQCLPPGAAARVTDQVRTLMTVSTHTWLVYVLLVTRPRIEATLVLMLFFALEVWSWVCNIHSDAELSRGITGVDSSPFFEYSLMYIQSMILVGIAPFARRIFINIFMAFLAVNGLIAIAELFKLGFTNHLLSVYQVIGNATQFEGGGVRPTGLVSIPSRLATLSLLGSALCISGLAVRKLTWYEVFAFLMLGAVVVSTQVRNCYLAYGIQFAIFCVGMVIRDKRSLALILCLITIVLTAAAPILVKKLSYGLAQTSASRTSVKYRERVAWAQSRKIFHDEPYFGLGRVSALGTYIGTARDKYSYHISIDNGYYLILSWYGIPGLILMCMVLVSGGVGAVLSIFRSDLSAESRRFSAFAALSVIAATTLMWFNNVFNSAEMVHIMIIFSAFAGREVSGLARSAYAGRMMLASMRRSRSAIETRSALP